MSKSQVPSLINAKKQKLFYGYVIVIVSFIIMMIIWGANYSFGVFFKPLLNEFDWPRSITSGTYALNMIFIGICGIFAGRLSDRFGPRLVLTISGVIVGLTFLLMSRVNNIWQVYLFYSLLGIGISGCGVPLFSTVARWFIKGRGLAIGMVTAGIGIGITIMPPVATQLISRYSWRTSYVIIGVVTMVLTPAMAQFLKRQPLPESPQTPKANILIKDKPTIQLEGLTAREAVHTRQFWQIAAIITFHLFCTQVVMVHIVAHATDLGVSPSEAAIILSAVGITSIFSKVGMGKLADKISSRKVFIIISAIMAISFLWLLSSRELWMLYLFAVIFGIGYGGSAAVQATMVADYFGLKAIGIILGYTGFITGVGPATGAFVPGLIFDINDSYYWAFMICAILGIVSAVLTILLKPARK